MPEAGGLNLPTLFPDLVGDLDRAARLLLNQQRFRPIGGQLVLCFDTYAIVLRRIDRHLGLSEMADVVQRGCAMVGGYKEELFVFAGSGCRLVQSDFLVMKAIQLNSPQDQLKATALGRENQTLLS